MRLIFVRLTRFQIDDDAMMKAHELRALEAQIKRYHDDFTKGKEMPFIACGPTYADAMLNLQRLIKGRYFVDRDFKHINYSADWTYTLHGSVPTNPSQYEPYGQWFNLNDDAEFLNMKLPTGYNNIPQ